MLFLYIISILSDHIQIRNTTLNTGSLIFKYTDTPYYVIVEYPKGVYFTNKQTLFLYIDKPYTLFYKKTLCKEYEYDWYMNIGIKIECTILYKDSIYKESLYDWICIPDFSMAFTSFSLFGVFSSIIYKVIFNY